MATKTWNNASAPYSTDADWSPAGTPAAGDAGIITGGTVLLTGSILDAVELDLTSSPSSSPALVATNDQLTASAAVTLTSEGNDLSLDIDGTLENAGTILLASVSSGISSILIGYTGDGATLHNTGTISVNGSGQIVTGGAGDSIVNDGAILFGSTSMGTARAFLAAPVLGTGTITVGANEQVEFNAGVAATQSVTLSAGSAVAQIDAPQQFLGVVSGLAAGATIDLSGVAFDSYDYITTAPGAGNLVLTQNGATVGSLALKGDYAPNSFAVSSSTQSGKTFAAITATGAVPLRVSATDTATNQSSVSSATAYTGPVSYLQYQYIWGSADGVVMQAGADSMFLHGNSGDDALQARAGSNVLDGGGGSNFLVGASGSDGGHDTFFIDGRGGGVTWSSVVNFHHGDAVTIFGFTAGVSTLPFSANEGAAGYTGATIHSELGGAGTGVNASVTFAGVSLADAQAKFTVSTGTVGGANYLNIAYTG